MVLGQPMIKMMKGKVLDENLKGLAYKVQSNRMAAT
jgi:hypothetical protein